MLRFLHGGRDACRCRRATGTVSRSKSPGSTIRRCKRILLTRVKRHSAEELSRELHCVPFAMVLCDLLDFSADTSVVLALLLTAGILIFGLLKGTEQW